ncbi:hypothetical protein Holit_01888 [Hollandina sp. SP2]
MKERRRILGISLAKLAERVSTSTHPPEKLEQIAAALEIDSPQLFSMHSWNDETLRRFQEGGLSGMGAAMAQAVDSRNYLVKPGKHVTSVKSCPQ